MVNFEVMKYRLLERVILLGIFLNMPSFIFAKVVVDSLVVDRLFSYHRNLAPRLSGFSDNFYLKYTFRTVRRNPTLFFVPTMYSIAKGHRNYIGENVGKITFNEIDNFKIEQQTLKSTIPHNRNAMNVMMKFIIPNLYGISLYDKYMLSPFNYNNRIFYRYRISPNGDDKVCINFTPRLNNTQLVEGYAIVDRLTGKIIRTRFRGNYDMISFEVNAIMGPTDSPYAILPVKCDSKATFRFMGNEIRVRFFAHFGCVLPEGERLESLSIENIRPDSLDRTEKKIYNEFYIKSVPNDTVASKKQKHRDRLAKKAWNVIDDYLLSGQDARVRNASLTFSPLFNPLYMSYSNSRGLAYKMDIGARYNFSSDRYITFTPRLGYNFKIKKFFFNAPLRYIFNSKRNGWVELTWSNGNRITNSSVLEMIQEENRDTIDFSSLNLDYFDDEVFNLSGNLRLNKHMELTIGCIYHNRTAVNKQQMQQAGKPTIYSSFAPSIKFTFVPYSSGPIFTANYEKSLSGVFKSNIKYERWEFDASYKKMLHSLRQCNLRVGGGFYTDKSSEYFVDFANFHENYLPGGWDDDMAGDFQLLNSQWYNASKYYFRVNASYSSPLLLLTWIPLVGRYIETERFYFNFLQIEHTRPYSEIGYGMTNRYFSIGIFGSFLNGKFNEFGSKFSFELFRKW